MRDRGAGWLLPAVVAAAGAVAYLVADPPSADLMGQRFRVDLFEREGFTLFSTAWYGGHHTPAYSVLLPPLGALLGPRLVAAAGAVALVAFVAAIAGERGRLAGVALVPGALASLVSGRLAFTLGAGIAAGATLAATRGRPWLAGTGGALTALASPVAALFAALAGAALAAAGSGATAGGARHVNTAARGARDGDTARRAGAEHGAASEHGASAGAGARHLNIAVPGTFTLRCQARSHCGARHAHVALVVGAAVPTVFLAVAFPEGGTFPFVASSFWPTFAAAVAVVVAAPRGWRAVRVGAGMYAVLALVAFVVPSPIGGNAARLGTLLAAPVAALALWPRRRAVLALLALPIAYWTLQPAVRDWLRAHDDPSVEAAFHAPVAAFLERRQPARVEVPFTQNHGETLRLARRLPIARGWERQLDRERNALFYDGALTPERYAAWLRENAIGYVAVPLGLPMDASAEAEKTLALAGPASLREVFRSEDWRVFATTGARPLSQGSARLVELRPEGFVVNAPQPGANTIRVRFTPYWAVLEGEGCVERAPGGWTRVRTRRAGRVEVGTRFALGRIRATSPRCTD